MQIPAAARTRRFPRICPNVAARAPTTTQSPHTCAIACPKPGPHKLASLRRAPGKNPGPHQHGRMLTVLGAGVHPLGEPGFGPSVILCHQVIVNGLRGVPLPSKTQKRMSLKVCSTPCVCCKSSQDFKALSICGPCVAWDSGLQGFVGAMRCMGLDHTSGLAGGIHCGPTDTSSLKLQGEVGGWRWLSGVRRCASLKDRQPFDKSGSVSTSSPWHCL